MVTINHQVKIGYEGSEKEWLVPSQFIKDAENCDWHQWLQIRASYPGFVALLFPRKNGKRGILGQFMLMCPLLWFLCYSSMFLPYL